MISLLVRLLRWIILRIGFWRLLSLTLLLAALASVALGLDDVVRGLDTRLMLAMIAIGLLVGWALAAMPLPGWAAWVLTPILDFGIVFPYVGRLGGQLLALLRTLPGLCWETLRWYQEGPLPDWIPLVRALMDLWAGASTVFTRVWNWIVALRAGESSLDPVAVALVWSLIVWAVSAWAGWVVRRGGHPLHAITPAGVLLVATLSYAGGDAYVLLALLGTTLLLLALVGYDLRVRHWQAAGMDFPDLGQEVVTAAVLLSLVLVSAAAVAPSLSMQKIVDFVERLGNDQADGSTPLGRSLGVEQRPAPAPMTALDAARAGGLPRHHLIGSGPELSSQVVMFISTGDLPPGPPEYIDVQSRPAAPRYYWRSLTYDKYIHSGWFTGRLETVRYAAGEPVITPTLITQRRVRQDVRVVGNTGGLLHVAGTLVAADHEYSVAWRSSADLFAATTEATTYRADSVVPVVTEEQLRSAGSDYPKWVTDRYLALPEDMPARVTALALDLTATKPTPYDQARAIETYLRAISYTLDVSEPPPGRDVVDYFLFDLKKGYCDYYATAMVVLARAAGLPARLVIGYATGSYDPPNAYYIVTEANAHAWPEIYFPGYGWIEFEPTAGLPPIARGGESTALEWPQPQGALQAAPVRWAALLTQYGWLLFPGGPILLILLVVAWWGSDVWRLRRVQPAAAAAALYRRLQRYGRRLAVPMQAGDTPYEFAALLTGRVTELAQERDWGTLLLPATQEVRHLTDLHVQGSYSPRLPDAADRALAIRTWQKLRWRLWLARMGQRRRLFGKRPRS